MVDLLCKNLCMDDRKITTGKVMDCIGCQSNRDQETIVQDVAILHWYK